MHAFGTFPGFSKRFLDDFHKEGKAVLSVVWWSTALERALGPNSQGKRYVIV
jgi:hypothetical protein